MYRKQIIQPWSYLLSLSTMSLSPSFLFEPNAAVLQLSTRPATPTGFFDWMNLCSEWVGGKLCLCVRGLFKTLSEDWGDSCTLLALGREQLVSLTEVQNVLVLAPRSMHEGGRLLFFVCFNATLLCNIERKSYLILNWKRWRNYPNLFPVTTISIRKSR